MKVIAIPSLDCLFGIPGVLKLDEGEAGGTGGQLQVDPHQASEPVKKAVGGQEGSVRQRCEFNGPKEANLSDPHGAVRSCSPVKQILDLALTNISG